MNHKGKVPGCEEFSYPGQLSGHGGYIKPITTPKSNVGINGDTYNVAKSNLIKFLLLGEPAQTHKWLSGG